ncbi:tryptophan 2,3-dioxygenase family protein [soil metagenome]
MPEADQNAANPSPSSIPAGSAPATNPNGASAAPSACPFSGPRAENAPVPPVAEGRLTYGSYLKVPELLTLQVEQSNPVHRDELLFIISHQVYELWFKQMLHELRGVCDFLDQDKPLRAAQLFSRIHVIQHLLIDQLPLLETMSAVDFAQFRDHLRPASGFQSIQFRLVEFIAGYKNAKVLGLVGEDAASRKRMEGSLAAPTVYDHFLRFLSRQGYPIPQEILERDLRAQYAGDERVVAALVPIYRDNENHYAVFRLCEHFVEFDERLSLWRFHHVKMVERMIGTLGGTGGSSGAKYLQSTVANRLYPDLWSVRDHLGGGYGDADGSAKTASGGGCPMGYGG